MNRLVCWLALLAFTLCAADAGAEPVTVILSFGTPGDPDAEDLERAFRFAAEHAATPFAAVIVHAASAFEAASIAGRAMQDDGTRLVVCAGDEGSAVAVALLSKQLQTPVLKLTSEPRSFTSLSSWLYEFLPSLEAQGEVLGNYVVKQRMCRFACSLTPDDDRGSALASGFRMGVERSKGVLDGERFYAAGAPRILPELTEIYRTQASRLSAADAAIALSAGEREELFGDSAGGEVLAVSVDGAAAAAGNADHDALFFALGSDRIDAYAAQLKTLSRHTLLCGNSGWIHDAALERNRRVTDDMLIVSPMLPVPRDTSAMLTAYHDATDTPASEWELLGLDAAAYVARALAAGADSRAEVIRIMNELDQFDGAAVQVDFRYGHENRAARLLEYSGGGLKVIK
ncbi:ABC transporter substrate-binding protein [candidate division KSB1 bacterium]|nr:ABC transporter substrate-binding protein [candidate division KSB1 bacterium]